MTIVTGYVVDVIRSSTYASTEGFTYISGATIYVGTSSTTTSSNGYFAISGDATQPNVVVKQQRYNDTEVASTSAQWINVWKNKGYT
jgi:hypothetical protein